MADNLPPIYTTFAFGNEDKQSLKHFFISLIFLVRRIKRYLPAKYERKNVEANAPREGDV